ncbi:MULTISPECIES: hypothetical protein [Ralstonia]|uniref:Uncharacterized protein n=1 Tax=Ralstonia flaminis TaxID=3058597 RepID=A0ABN9JT49_9RALS|nr:MULTISPECIES: hypothetical protein [unclassified Ralstonia]CAJ0821664.1 hypothetical protein LMG18101_04701 [Ralstonia sp. LMG 18101]
MKQTERDNLRHILLGFAELTAPARHAFLGAMNEYLFSSPQRRRQIVEAWKQPDAPAPDKPQPRSVPPAERPV